MVNGWCSARHGRQRPPRQIDRKRNSFCPAWLLVSGLLAQSTVRGGGGDTHGSDRAGQDRRGVAPRVRRLPVRRHGSLRAGGRRTQPAASAVPMTGPDYYLLDELLT